MNFYLPQLNKHFFIIIVLIVSSFFISYRAQADTFSYITITYWEKNEFADSDKYFSNAGFAYTVGGDGNTVGVNVAVCLFYTVLGDAVCHSTGWNPFWTGFLSVSCPNTDCYKVLFMVVNNSNATIYGGGNYDQALKPIAAPNCNTSPSCSGSCTAPANTCSTDNGTRNGCVYTAYSGGGSCNQVSAPNQSCSINNCSAGYTCSGGICVSSGGGGGGGGGGSIPPAPSGLSASCPAPGTSANVSWNSSIGATSYSLRVDNETANGWSGLCNGSQNPGDICHDQGGTSYPFSSNSGSTYRWWVHACNTSGCSGASGGPGFTCLTSPPPPPLGGTCGNGVLDVGEQCDYGHPEVPSDCGTTFPNTFCASNCRCESNPTPSVARIKAVQGLNDPGYETIITITPNTSVDLYWGSDNADNCVSENWGTWGGLIGKQGGPATPPESQNMASSYTFRIRCYNASSSDISEVPVNVTSAIPLPMNESGSCSGSVGTLGWQRPFGYEPPAGANYIRVIQNPGPSEVTIIENNNYQGPSGSFKFATQPGLKYHWQIRTVRTSDGAISNPVGGEFICDPTCDDGLDIGLRLRENDNPLCWTCRIAVERFPPLNSPLRIHKDGITYGVVLINPASIPNASKMRVQTSSGVKALCIKP